MNAYADKAKEGKLQSEGFSIAKKKNDEEFNSKFLDNRPEAISQRKIQQMADGSELAIQSRDFQNLADIKSQDLSVKNDISLNTIQRMVAVDLLVDDSNKKKIRARGKVEDFQGGTSAGEYGWVGVTSYRSDYKVSDGKYENSGNVGPLKNKFTNPEAGHVLAKQNGGDGTDTWNVFAQDGGTNNGDYKSFEIAMRKDLNLYKGSDDVEFTSYLAGKDIEDSGKISDAGESDADSISSEDSN